MSAAAELGVRREPVAKAQRVEIALVVCLVLALLLFAWTALATLSFPYDWGYGEGPLMDQARRIAAGETLYKANLNEPPYVIANYPPLFPSLVAGIGTLTALPFLQVGRAISLCSALVSGLAVGALASRLSGSRHCGFLAAVLFLANPFVMHWSRMARVDLMALALSLVALWVLYRRWRSWHWLSVAIVCLLASMYTRQTYALAAPAAAIAWLWYREQRRALVFVAVLAVCALALFGLLNLFTQGGFYTNIVAANVNPYLPTRTLSMGALLLGFCPVIVTFAGFEISRAWSRRTWPDDEQRSGGAEAPFLLHGLLPYTLGAFLTALTIGKIGSHVNYFVELMAALAIWAAVALGRQPQRAARRRCSVQLLMLCQVAWLLGIGLSIQAATQAQWDHLSSYDGVYHQVKTATEQGPVLADDLMGMVVMSGQRLYFQPFEYRQLQTAGLWNGADLVSEVEQQKFPLMLLSNPGSDLFAERWSPAMAEAIDERYERTGRLGDVVLYRPKPVKDSASE